MSEKVYELLSYVEGRMRQCKPDAYPELFEIRSQLNDILSEHYVKRNKRNRK